MLAVQKGASAERTHAGFVKERFASGAHGCRVKRVVPLQATLSTVDVVVEFGFVAAVFWDDIFVKASSLRWSSRIRGRVLRGHKGNLFLGRKTFGVSPLKLFFNGARSFSVGLGFLG